VERSGSRSNDDQQDVRAIAVATPWSLIDGLADEKRAADSGDQAFSTTVEAFGRTRRLELTAFYGGSNRGQMLQALERVFFSLSLRDGAAAKE
jgi:hypothetical protein